MVARLVWDQDAAGSNPVTSTTPKNLKSRLNAEFFRFLFLSKSIVYPTFYPSENKKKPKGRENTPCLWAFFMP